MDFAVPADQRKKKWHKFFDLAREQKMLWNRRVTVIPIIICELGAVSKDLVRGLEELEMERHGDTIISTALLISTRILRIVLMTYGDLPSLRLQWKTISKRYCKNLAWNNNDLISAKRPDLIIINKKKKKKKGKKENLQNCGLCCPGWPQNKTEGKWKKKR